MGKLLLVVKKSFYERYGQDLEDPHFLRLLHTESGISQELRAAHDEHLKTVEAVITFLKQQGIEFEECPATCRVFDGRGDLVISVGGDGTLLAASHGVIETPVLGVNSRPGRSVGYFCLAEAEDFRPILGEVLEGRRQPRKLARMDLLVNGAMVAPPALNDILFASQCPAATTNYRLEFDGRRELQKGSGVWVSTPAGSTAGIQGSGGEQMDVSEERLQFLVREPYAGGRDQWELLRGYFTDGLMLTNLTPEGAIYVDGTRIVHTVNYGDVIVPKISNRPLSIFL